METSETIDLARRALMLILVIGSPVLIIGLAVAMAVSVLQALTQVQEQTLSFVPKILAMLGSLIIFGPWMFQKLVEFSREMFTALP